MSSWIPLTRDMIVARLNATELRVVGSIGAGSEEPVEQIRRSTIAEIRGAIMACRQNRLDNESDTIPAALVNDALSLICYYILSRVPASDIETQARYNAFSKAQQKLASIASCAIQVEDPFGHESTPSSGSGVSITPPFRNKFSKRNWAQM